MHRQGQGPTGEGGRGGEVATVAGGGRHTLLDQARQWSRLLAPGGGGGVFWWHSNVPAKYSSLLALLEAPCSAGTWTWEPRLRGGRGTSPVLGGSGIQGPPTASHPATPFRKLWRAPRWDCVSTCACFHVYFQHKREAPQVERRACVLCWVGTAWDQECG